MISVILSRPAGSGRVTVEKVYEWARPDDVGAHQDDLSQRMQALSEQYGASREVFTASARNLESLCQAYPEYEPWT